MYVLIFLKNEGGEIIKTVCSQKEFCDLILDIKDGYEFVYAEVIDGFDPDFMNYVEKDKKLETG